MKRELQKQMLKRNIIFWGKIAEKHVFMMTVIVFLYGIFFFCLNGNWGKFDGIWDTLFIYQFMMAQVNSFVIAISYGVSYIPLVISFGSKRKEAVWGSQLMNWLVIVQMEALLLLFAGLSSKFSERFTLFAILAPIGMIIGVSLGQFAAAIGLKFGMKGMWIVMVVAIVWVFIMAVAGILFLAEDVRSLFLEYLPAVGGVLAGMLYIESTFVMLRTIRNYEMHR